MKNILNFTKKIRKICVAAAIFAVFVLGTYNNIIPDSVSYMSGESLPSFAGATAKADGALLCSKSTAEPTVYTAQYKLWGIIPLKTVSVSVYRKTSLYIGGMPFGVRFSTDGVMVVGYGSEPQKSENPAYNAGIRPADVIKKIDGAEITDVGKLTAALEACGGKAMSFVCERDGEEYTFSLTPYYSSAEGKYKTGLLVRDSGAGIGTVTYIVPDSNSFGGLGHGICDGETGSLIPLERGTVTDVTINGVVKGIAGTPGELRGSFSGSKTGTLTENTDKGVFGMFATLPENHGELMPIGLKDEIKSGDAYIVCTLDTGGPQKYKIQISDIDRDSDGNKCFTVKVTDKTLLEKTGGIVQGMSGSPIIQNGKLIGAVTHVLINDPSCGYGIFIENMLTAMPELLR